MAVFTAANPNVAVDMYQLFAFEPTFGSNTIDSLTPPSPAFGTVTVTDNLSPSGSFAIVYSNINGTEEFFAAGPTGTLPISGSFDKAEIFINGVLQGTLSGIAPGFGSFGQIDLIHAHTVLTGNDTITGSNLGDRLFTGDGGTDSVDAKGGNDIISMAAATGAPSHSINGGAGTDWIAAVSNVFTADKVLDLRSATLLNIENLLIEGGVTVRLLGSQIGAGLASSAEVLNSFGISDATLEIVMNVPGVLSLSGFTIGPGVSVVASAVRASTPSSVRPLSK